MQQPLFQFSESFVDVVAPDALAMARDAREAFGREIDKALPSPMHTYWDGDDYVIHLSSEQTATEFGGGGRSPRPTIRPVVMKAAYEAKKAFEEVVAE